MTSTGYTLPIGIAMSGACYNDGPTDFGFRGLLSGAAKLFHGICLATVDYSQCR